MDPQAMRFLSFTVLIGGGALLGHLCPYLRLVPPAVASARWRRSVGVLLIVVTAFLLLRRHIPDLGADFADASAIVAYGWMAFAFDLAPQDRDPDRAAILLARQPANFAVAASRGVDLQISGHTHGGQLFPVTALAGLVFEHVRGLYHDDEARLYVSRGCGFWGPPARVGSPPEIVKITLTT